MHSALWRAVTGGMDVPANIEKALSAKLKRRGKPTATSPMIVVVLDEIDQLISQNRQVLRKLFEWADAPKSRLVGYLFFHRALVSGMLLFSPPSRCVWVLSGVRPLQVYVEYAAQPTASRYRKGETLCLACTYATTVLPGIAIGVTL